MVLLIWRFRPSIYISIGPMHRVIWCWKYGMESVTHIVTGMEQSENSVQSHTAVSMSGQR